MYDELADSGDGGEEQQQQQQQPGQQEDLPPPGGNMDDFLADAPLPDDETIPIGSKSPIQSEKDEQSMDIPTVKSPEEPINAEQSPEANSEGVKNEKKKDAEKEDDESALAPTQLGNALDSLMMHWCQLLTNVTVKPPVPPPSTLDHVKEVAEVCSKHFRDASVDVNNEFTRLGLQWEMEEISNQSIIEESHLDEAIERQERLLEQAREIIRQRLEQFHKECPNAGTQFTT